MINYPNKKVASKSNQNVKKDTPAEKNIILNAANRGMDFEHAISLSCLYYDENQRAILTKRPTPIKILKTDYKKGRITDAVFEKQSNTDYNGVYRGKYIDFECKETQSKTSLAFHNIPLHQIKHLKKVLFHGGIAFFMIYFKTLDQIYLVDSKFVIEKYEKGEKKSISLEEIKEVGYLVKQGFIPRVNFLDVVDEVYFDEKKQ